MVSDALLSSNQQEVVQNGFFWTVSLGMAQQELIKRLQDSSARDQPPSVWHWHGFPLWCCVVAACSAPCTSRRHFDGRRSVLVLCGHAITQGQGSLPVMRLGWTVLQVGVWAGDVLLSTCTGVKQHKVHALGALKGHGKDHCQSVACLPAAVRPVLAVTGECRPQQG
jgi:hypothetical protein